jgi:hypothetical protein
MKLEETTGAGKPATSVLTVSSQNTVIFKDPVIRTSNLHTKLLIPPDAAN